jgi:hypothetical protein
MTIYIGWVPTVGRRLSYSIIGHTNHPSVAETANVADIKIRRILCLQTRTLLDSALPIFKSQLARLFFNYDGSFVFLLDAECTNNLLDKDQTLHGRLYIFKDNIDNEVDKNILGLKYAISELNEYNSSLSKQCLDVVYSGIKENYLKNIKENSIFSADFILERDGLIGIDFNGEEELEHLICAQLFFFIKDIAHRHQHHHPKTDTILDVYKLSSPNWQDEILRSLYKRVLDFKRSRNEWVCASALGIITYIKAFKKVCDSKGIVYTVNRDDDDLSESIKITRDELRHLTSQMVGFRNVWIATGIAIIGLMLMFSSLGAMVSPVVQIPSCAKLIKFISGNIIDNLLNTILVVMTFSMFFSVLIYKEYWIGKLLWHKDMIRLSVSIKYKFIAGAVLALFSAIFGYAAYWVLTNYDELKYVISSLFSIIRNGIATL